MQLISVYYLRRNFLQTSKLGKPEIPVSVSEGSYVVGWNANAFAKIIQQTSGN